MASRYFNGVVPITQLALAPLLLQNSFLLQNFKPGFIQTAAESQHDAGGAACLRPSRAEIRWYGGTDEGLADVRERLDLWALESEKRRFKELEQQYGNTKTKLELVEMLLAEDWPSKLRQKLNESNH
jgi:hypothetical protein